MFPSGLPSTEFRGTPRFELISRLGAGGMGEVFRAFDRERDTIVALKVLKQQSADMLLRFKNEFRRLQDVQHPNLVSLGELFHEGGHWFFTMELCDGFDFLTWVCPSQSPLAHEAHGPLDETRLRQALAQLCIGLGALHEANVIHRDIKPSNVLCDVHGVVKIVDFGLATENKRDPGLSDPSVVGSVGYMAPEQAASRAVGPAADWYSTGCIVYEALTGLLPFRGGAFDVMLAKQRALPPHPRSLNPNVADDLADICMGLLRTDPAERLDGQAILKRLGPQPLPSASASSMVPSGELRPSEEHAFIGRKTQLGELERALADVGQGRSVTILIEAGSGIGKTALIRRFSQGLGKDAVVLSGRCFERESVPYKAFDGIIDALSRYLQSLDRAESELLLPEDTALLATVFPVLRRVEAIARQQDPRTPRGVPIDRQEQRLRTFAALRGLLGRLSDSRLVVLVVEDLQWADLDSLALLAEVMRHPDPPSLLLIATSRTTEAQGGGSPGSSPLDSLVADVRRLRLGPLEPHETLQLIHSLLPDDAPIDPATLVGESGGHPLFVVEMIRHILDDGATGEVRLDEALRSRLDRLDATMRHLLELIVVSGTPISQDAAARAAGLEFSEYVQRINALRIARLIRSGGPRNEDTVEAYHARISEVVMSALAADALRDLHERLAVGLEASGRADAESLATHWRGAGQNERAAAYFALAASQASAALAFDRAARLYRLALELGPRSTAGWPELQADLGETLANAGRGREAAQAFLAAAVGQSVADSVELQRRAAEQLLRSGLIEDGLEVLTGVLNAIGLADTMSVSRAGMWWQAQRAQWRGLKFERRDESQITRQQLAAIDVCWSVAICLALVDPMRGLAFQQRHLRLALDAGEPVRVARALAIHACFIAAGQTRDPITLLRQANDLASEAKDARAEAWAVMAKGIAGYLRGDFMTARVDCDRAQKTWRVRCNGAFWEIANCQLFALWALAQSGEIGELSRRLPQYLREAHDRGDLYSATNLRIGHSGMYWLALDDPDGGRRELLTAMRRWPTKQFYLQHYYDLFAQTQLDLYLGEGLRAYERLLEKWDALEQSRVMTIRGSRIDAEFLRARVILATARRTANRRPLLRNALALAKTIEGHAAWASGHAYMIRAAVAWLNKEQKTVLTLLQAAVEAYDRAGMRLYACAARYRIGQLLGNDEGRAMVQTATIWAQQQSIKNPLKMISMLAPGMFE